MKKIASKHGLTCLLHEKPFAGVNGSGKHNNWSMCTDTGYNLLEPGKSPYENAQFLLFLCAVIKAVDEYQDLLRISVASAGNDHRLGANEAPPAIVSMFLGDELTEILEAIESKSSYSKREKVEMQIGVDVLPHFPKDTTDRNRTSPFAFTGNKFEFRMLGSMLSIAGPNLVLNTIVAEALSQFADQLEQAPDFTEALNKLIRRTIREHKRIIFNGNNYTDEWVEEAERRGLLNLRTTPEALPLFTAAKNVRLFARHCIFTEAEIRSRMEILLDNYIKTIQIESLTMVELTKKDILPPSLLTQASCRPLRWTNGRCRRISIFRSNWIRCAAYLRWLPASSPMRKIWSMRLRRSESIPRPLSRRLSAVPWFLWLCSSSVRLRMRRKPLSVQNTGRFRPTVNCFTAFEKRRDRVRHGPGFFC